MAVLVHEEGAPAQKHPGGHLLVQPGEVLVQGIPARWRTWRPRKVQLSSRSGAGWVS